MAQIFLAIAGFEREREQEAYDTRQSAKQQKTGKERSSERQLTGENQLTGDLAGATATTATSFSLPL